MKEEMEMSNSADVRVVRCPKCDNWLPELTDYSVYQCGACGAVLKAMDKGVDLDTFSDEEMTEGSIQKQYSSDRYETIKKIGTRRSNDSSESDTRSTVSSSRRGGESRRTRMNSGQDYERSAELQRVKAVQYYEDADIYRGHIKPGPSNHVSKFGYDYENPSYGFNGVGDDDRVEILKKLDELTDHLSRSGSLSGKGKEKAPLDRRRGQQDPYASDNWYSDEPSVQNRRQQPYPNHYAEPPLAMYGAGGFYPPSPVYRSGPHPPYHMMPPQRVFKSGPYVDDDTMEPSYPPKLIRHRHHHHHLSCSCNQCLSDKYSEVHYHDHLSRDGSRDNDRRFSSEGPRPLKSHNAQSHSRWSSGMSSEADSSFTHRGPTRKIRLPSGGKKCRPVAGGAPFLTCNNCFVLLQLPENVWMNGSKKRRNKMSCGSCSTVILLAVFDNKLVVSFGADPDKNSHGRVDNVRTTFSSVDYDSNSRHSASEAEVANGSSVADLAKDDKGQRPSSGLSLQDHFEYSNKYHRQEVISRTRNDSSATEIDLSSNEYSNTGATSDSGKGSSGAAKSFFAGVGFGNDSRKPDRAFEQEKASVTVNGHLISGQLVRKAEKLAGPIHPGNYWYDFRAGFWGAMGGPCLGIIPPFIEEFHHPMPEGCAGGNTGIFVNDRELNQKDLNLLGGRGLPTERDRSYIVEISGRVLEVDTGNELESLGKLAPTVERTKRGFGMRAPKAVA